MAILDVHQLGISGSRCDKGPTFDSGVNVRVGSRHSGDFCILRVGSRGSRTGASTSVEILARTRFCVREQQDLGMRVTHGDPK